MNEKNSEKDKMQKRFLRKLKSPKIKQKFLKTTSGCSESKQNLPINEKFKKEDFYKKLELAIKGLNYISETDSEFFPFIGETSEFINQEILLKQINADLNEQVEEREFEEFFERLIRMQDWFDDAHRKMAENFLYLKNLLKENLKDIKVYKVGRIQIDIYIVGLDRECNLIGVHTKAIET